MKPKRVTMIHRDDPQRLVIILQQKRQRTKSVVKGTPTGASSNTSQANCKLKMKLCQGHFRHRLPDMLDFETHQSPKSNEAQMCSENGGKIEESDVGVGFKAHDHPQSKQRHMAAKSQHNKRYYWDNRKVGGSQQHTTIASYKYSCHTLPEIGHAKTIYVQTIPDMLSAAILSGGIVVPKGSIPR